MARLVILVFFLVLAAAAAADVTLRTVTPRPLLSPLRRVPAPWRTTRDDSGDCDSAAAGDIVCAENCTKVLLCMGGTLDPIVVEECVEPLACNAQEGACVSGLSSCGAANTTITCTSLGMFPDPYVCTAYHICYIEGGQSVREKCDSGWAYDPLTTLCSKQLTDSVCTNLPIECNTLGASNTFPGNSNIYYICVADTDGNMYPELFRCPHGADYDPATYSCADSSR